MWRRDGDFLAEVLCRLFVFAGEELDLPAQYRQAGRDLAPLHGLQGMDELAAGRQEFLEADQRTCIVIGRERGGGPCPPRIRGRGDRPSASPVRPDRRATRSAWNRPSSIRWARVTCCPSAAYHDSISFSRALACGARQVV
ncbi:hypothetical protein SLNWT_7048 [Streptomyces albus]|uniref:Uncharacterized protein n=1 Tax=Streptomyces albus (strain ATCC 21838 / DSM 41398 / FERM P-419 / JCM 4703 / NBRC 107858) TaxID=1081613 RepID=A0A0B5F020_STRA4|nr:hypothetical protein SLNWT_7048 [Streptomyces albus]AOU81727.1 hypothetical protein SLNHY_7036 [Streptomyces albus]AYN37417.1 hypothetical protein DUI70_6924 [Streptomyces albus]